MVLVGGFSICRRHMEWRPDYRLFSRSSQPCRPVPPVLNGIRHLDSRSIIRLGIMLLIATPIMGVSPICVYGFATQKDKMYIVVSGISSYRLAL